MNILFLLIPSLILYAFGYWVYARLLDKAWGVDPNRKTPAEEMNDGVDYVPTKLHVLFAHHFSTIAGAGPIVGPATALIYGALPAWLWIVFGAVFVGAVHDFACLFVSVRNKGRSMAEIARAQMGGTAFALFILFLLVLIIIVNGVFLMLTAKSLTSLWPIEKLNLPADQTYFASVVDPASGVASAKIGGIASTSVILITLCAPLMGWAVYKRGMSMLFAYPAAAAIAVVSVFVGFYYPITFEPGTWQTIFSVYILLAAGLPVWVILQPRDFVNVQILYGGLFLLVASLLSAGFQGAELLAPAWNVVEGSKTTMGVLWPGLFITIACGAISGFHGIVGSGVTSKQMTNETHARKVGYLAMLGESTLGLCVTLSIGAGIAYADYLKAVWPMDLKQANPILGFALGAAGIFEKGFGIPSWLGVVFGILLVEGFVVTTLDTSVRLNRYLFEEFWRVVFRNNPPKALLNPWVNSLLAVVCMWAVAKSGVWARIWALFGSANQLLGALSLIVVTVWLKSQKRTTIYTLLPCVALCVTTVWSLVQLVPKYIQNGNWVLAGFDIFLLITATGLIAIGFLRYLRPPPAAPAETM
ncbi:MAG: carbon starvation protein A [Planctomycetota bacterium]|nr:carbon starvation protein A [Planctomycetota bacterium]